MKAEGNERRGTFVLEIDGSRYEYGGHVLSTEWLSYSNKNNGFVCLGQNRVENGSDEGPKMDQCLGLYFANNSFNFKIFL